MVNVTREHIPSGPSWPNIQDRYEHGNKVQLIVKLLSIVHSGTAYRCQLDMDPARRIKNRIPLEVFFAPTPHWGTTGIAAKTAACEAPFDIRPLPYRWLPGLPRPPTTVRELLPLDEALHAKRFEVMHIADYWPGPVRRHA